MGAQVLETISRDRDEYISYFHQLKAEVDRESQILYAINEGEIRGEIKGKVKTAKKLLEMGFPIEKISEATGLTIYEIQSL